METQTLVEQSANNELARTLSHAQDANNLVHLRMVQGRKNFTEGYSDIQIQFQQATSIHKNGPTMFQLEALSNATHHPTMFADIVYMLNERLNDHGKHWKHVYKSLVVLEYCVVCGSDTIVQYAKESLYTIRTLKDFQYIDRDGRDQGITVRQKAIEIVALLSDEAKLDEARRTKCLPRNLRSASTEPAQTYHNNPSKSKALREESRTKRALSDSSTLNKNSASFAAAPGYNEEEALKMAIEESRRTAAQSMHVMPLKDHTDVLTLSDDQFDRSLLKYHSTTDVDPFAVREEQSSNVASLVQDPFGNDTKDAVTDDHDPFADLHETFLRSRASVNASRNTQQQAQQSYIPMPLAPGQAPPSADPQIGAKPVQPFTSAPQFSAKPDKSQQRGNGSKHPNDDPFA